MTAVVAELSDYLPIFVLFGVVAAFATLSLIASSFLMKGERGPVALGYNSYVRRKLFWSTCWDCRGDSGNVTYREDNRVVITQK